MTTCAAPRRSPRRRPPAARGPDDGAGARAKLMAPPSKQPRGQQPRGQARRWTDEEHEEFLAAVGRFGKRKTVAEHVPSKTAAQVRTHATKLLRSSGNA